MADLFPTDLKRIRERIRRYERALKRELERIRWRRLREAVFAGTTLHVDGDVDGARLPPTGMKTPTRRRRRAEPIPTWALALFRGGRRQEAFNKVYETMLEYLYP